MSSRPSSDMTKFKSLLAESKHVVVLTGAGVSAESGIPTFRGPGGYWRKWKAQDLATPEAFYSNPSLTWEFYHHRREDMVNKLPNAAHKALAKFEKDFKARERRVAVITQNIDGLHREAGSKNVIELHGNLFKTRCVKCQEVVVNRDSPICESLRNRGAPEPDANCDQIPEMELPRCKKDSCRGLLRPHVIWFGESLESAVLDATQTELDQCDLCLLVGTSSVVYPAAGFAPELAAKGVPVAEFNMEDTPATHQLGFHFKGKAGELLPTALEMTTEPK